MSKNDEEEQKNKGGQNRRLESKKGSHKKWSRSEKWQRQYSKGAQKRLFFIGYGDEGNKLRRRRPREMRPRTKGVKKKRDKEIIWKRKMRSRNKRWTKKEKKKKKEEKRREKKNGETKGRKKKKR